MTGLEPLTHGSVSTGCVTSGSVVLMSCVVLAESGDAPGVDVTHKEVKRDTAGRRPRESDTTQSTAKVTHLHCYTLCYTARGYSAGW